MGMQGAILDGSCQPVNGCVLHTSHLAPSDVLPRSPTTCTKDRTGSRWFIPASQCCPDLALALCVHVAGAILTICRGAVLTLAVSGSHRTCSFVRIKQKQTSEPQGNPHNGEGNPPPTATPQIPVRYPPIMLLILSRLYLEAFPAITIMHP